jgi:DNA-binding CsgD family transcriptional regulator
MKINHPSAPLRGTIRHIRTYKDSQSSKPPFDKLKGTIRDIRTHKKSNFKKIQVIEHPRLLSW